MSKRAELERAIEALEAQKDILGEAAVATVLSSLRAQLATLTATVEQRKQVTALVADISGFTAFSAERDAEEVGEMMNGLWRRLDGVIQQHNGWIDKHVGDAVIAIWGREQAREDDAEQAVRAGLALHKACQQFAGEQSISLQLRVGIHTDLVVFGALGITGEFSVTGPAVTVAEKLEGAAAVGTVLISRATYHQVRGLFKMEAGGELVAGEKVMTYLVLGEGERAFRPGTRGVEGVETRMVGRESELEQLQRWYREGAEAGGARLMTVVGEAGVGKSRVLFEFERWLGAEVGELVVLRGRATEQTAGVSYFIWRDMWGAFLGIQDSDGRAVVRQKIETGLRPYFGEDMGMAYVLGHWWGYDLSETAEVQALREDGQKLQQYGRMYQRRLLREMATAGVLLLLDDIHWADELSLALVREVVALLVDVPLGIICLTRPNLFETEPSWGAGGQRIDLKPLPSAADRELLHEILRNMAEIPAPLERMVLERSDGNPFYIEELIKMLIDEGVIETGGENGVWRVDEARLTTAKVPSSLTGVLQARLDKLEEESKQTLQRASVVGRVFWDLAVAEMGAVEREVRLRPLQARELVFAREESTFREAREFLFKHDLLRDVAYGSVLKRERRGYHRQVADWLVVAAARNGRTEEYAAVIGRHYALAEAGDEAREWYRLAGQKAAEVGDTGLAIRYMDEALALAPAVSERWELLKLKVKMHNLRGERALQREGLDEMGEVAAELGGQQMLQVLYYEALYHEALGRYEEALAYSKQLYQDALRQEEGRFVAEGLCTYGWVMRRQGRYEEAIEYMERALKISREIAHEEMISRCLLGLGTMSWGLGCYEDMIQYTEQSLEMGQKAGDLLRIAVCYNDLGEVERHRGEYEMARNYMERSLEMLKKIGHRSLESVVHYNLGAIALGEGRYEEAARWLQTSYEIAMATNNPETIALANLFWGNALLEIGRYEEALTRVEAAVAVRENLDHEALMIETLVVGAWVAAKVGERGMAGEWLAEALPFLLAGNMLDGSEFTTRNYWLAYQLCAEWGDERAEGVLAQGLEVLEKRLLLVQDIDFRQKMKEKVPWHREMLAVE
ncbi:MAG TPA: tetratricopeptide repeat protein [Anaerolineae bacterium]|nr:tetratricopeptide repeat protein [Anaerolineae bacterium]